jgi:hypothetical protein
VRGQEWKERRIIERRDRKKERSKKKGRKVKETRERKKPTGEKRGSCV